MLLFFAAACCCSTYALDRDPHVLALRHCLPKDMVTTYFAPVLLAFVQVFFFQINQKQPWNLNETSTQAAAA